MSDVTRMADSEKLAKTIVNGIQEKKGVDIVCTDLRGIPGAVCDFFVICHGESDRQVNGIAHSIEEEVRKKLGEKPWHVEGKENAEWVLLDYVNVVAHVFHREAREFYDIESLWADAKTERIEYAV